MRAREAKEGEKERRTTRGERDARRDRARERPVGWFTSEMARGKEQREGEGKREKEREREKMRERERESGRQTVSLK